MTDSVAATASVPTTSLGSVNTNAPALQALASLRQTEAALTDAVATVATGSLAPGLGTVVDVSA
ncbi:hypothetical protein [Ferrovibrio xuzhouensis]|uniref:Motility protein n=1 Tax=Ferrovibrio xuzhouensis TaxID=1576914 RepID=A0ABV7VNC7_9PROT